ncbi:MAG: acyl-CoA dehydrogenase family protein [Burkholderiaceae bacterium]|nr:acyl-CoA dehydrogenase family protein [Burkholderiaceae bacterium]
MIYGPVHEEIRDAIRRFVDREIIPFVNEWEENGPWPAHEICKKAGNAGFLGINRPEEYGGMGLDLSYAMVWAEEIGRIPAGGVATGLSITSQMATPALAAYGSDALRQEYLAPTIAGDLVACLGVSETGGGSDVANIKTTARRDGGDYVINGSKMWITNGAQADWVCLLCNTSAENGPHKNKSLIVVPLNVKGVSRSAPLKKMGMHSSDTAQLFFDDVRVPITNRIGEEGRGFIYQMGQFTDERLVVAARTVSQLQQCVDLTVDYTRQRQVFGKPILDNQWIQFTLAEYQMEIEALKSMTYRAVVEVLAGDQARLLTAAVKLKTGKLARSIPEGCLQFWGGMGYMADNIVGRLMRDSRLVSIGGGANEVMAMVVAREMGLSSH